MNKIKMIFIIICFSLFYVGCNEFKKTELVWDKIELDSNLKNYDCFKLMDMDSKYYKKQVSIDSSKYKRNCDIYRALINEKKMNMSSNYFDDFVCETHIVNDTINVKVCFNTGLSELGVVINVTNDKYSIHSYNFTDCMGIEKYFPKIKAQRLILDKKKYLLGDSIFGIFYLKMIDKFEGAEYWSGDFKCRIN